MDGEESKGLEAPAFLVATPQVHDPYFDHSVVLLLHHDDQGSFGFNLNRPTELPLADILEGLEIPWAGDPDSRAFFGGPVQPQLGTVLFRFDGPEPRSDQFLRMTATEIYPGVRMTQHVDDLALLAGSPPSGFRLYLGYAGWGAGQLVEEILRNDWILVPVIETMLFAPEPHRVWTRVLESVGVDPTTLPSWTQAQDDVQAN
jgi:putative transcriptional regulator